MVTQNHNYESELKTIGARGHVAPAIGAFAEAPGGRSFQAALNFSTAGSGAAYSSNSLMP